MPYNLSYLRHFLGNLSYAPQQNAKLENDWCETRHKKQSPLKIPETSKKNLSAKGI